MKGNELIEKILNKEIRSGALIKMTHNDGELKYDVILTFNGNWFSEGKYNHDGVNERHNDIILYLCDEYATFDLIEEDKKIEYIEGRFKNFKHYIKDTCFRVQPLEDLELNQNEIVIIDKINEIIKKINKLEEK